MTNETKRDPRLDPRPGDEISREFKTAIGGCVIRTVTEVRGNGFWVFYKRDNGAVARNEIDHIAAWRQWAANVAPEGEAK